MINDANTLDLDDLDIINDEHNDELTFSSDDLSLNSSEDNFNLTDELLATQGILDRDRIKFEDESGAVIEKSWDSLTNNEKLMILSHQEDPDTSLDNEEITLINLIRTSGLTPGQFVQYLQTPEPLEPIIDYEVDNMSDDELFCLDLLDKVGSDNVSDEELQEALEQAKLNESLYSKQVASLRDYYRDLENEKIELDLIEEEEAYEALYNAYANDILNSIQNFNVDGSNPIELSNNDMETLADFILTRDSTGLSTFDQLLQHPDQFVKAAFWVLHGPIIVEEMQNLMKHAYLRGYNENTRQNKVYTRSSSNKTNNIGSRYANFDEDSYLND